jgi:hypothetical protein
MPWDHTHSPGPVARIHSSQRRRAHSGDSAVFLPRLITQSKAIRQVCCTIFTLSYSLKFGYLPPFGLAMDNGGRRHAEEKRFDVAIVSHNE